MNIASIDIGSNTVLLLIADISQSSTEVKTILNKYEAPRLGRGLKKDGNIADESILKLMSVLKSYKKIIDEYKCEKVLCTATNAMRVAKNSDQIIKEVKQKYDIEINVISGYHEAELSYWGAATTLPGISTKIVMDIGGGSTEIIYGRDSEIIYKNSFPIGAVNTTEEFISNYPASEIEIKDLQRSVQNTFNELEDIVPKKIPLIAVAGTPTSLSAINLGLEKYVGNEVEGSLLSLDVINNFIKEFSKITPEEILKRYGDFLRGREDVILAGTFILKTVCEITGNKEVFVSGRGIRYGSVVDYLIN